MAIIPKKVQPLINGAFPEHVCLIGTVQPNGYAQITPRGSTQVYDDDHISLWERGRGSTNSLLADGTRVTVFYFNLGARDVLPMGGIARFYGTASVHKSGPVYDKVWERLIEPEKQWDPDKKGWAVLIKVERAEDLLGQALKVE
ncbi:MAG TPA: pyridoxamine 5'-phosphate oxidase family protein [Rhizomicrobium sp.]|nr:pyridoxamine 5'-phosphate oxidase family protein [Rhizomicrobium sp.]